ncbi:BA14K family protein [Rhizobiales bacterium]|nr:BA14K family protein [Hongsoonwoonella zoysiae]
MPLAKAVLPPAAQTDNSNLIQKVQSRGRRWRQGRAGVRNGRNYRRGRGYRGGRRYHAKRRYYRGGRGYYYGKRYYNPGAAAAAGIIGLATGAIIAGALSQPRYVAPAPAYRRGAYAPWTPEWYSYCGSRYRSFNPDTGYYLAYSGKYRFCR